MALSRLLAHDTNDPLPMTPSDEELAEAKRVAEAAEKAAPGEWEPDSERVYGYRYASVWGAVACVAGQHRKLVDTLNADSAITEEEREDLAAHIAHFNPSFCSRLLTALEAAKAENEALREALEPFAAMPDRSGWGDDSILARSDYEALKVADFRRARSALGEGVGR